MFISGFCRLAVFPGGVAGQVFEEVHPGVLEVLAVHAEAQEQDAEVVLGALLAVFARLLGGGASGGVGFGGERQAEQDVGLGDAGVPDAVEDAELGGAGAPDVVQVQAAVAAVVVVFAGWDSRSRTGARLSASLVVGLAFRGAR